jgi:archaellum biogenesis ATPase FlaH|tara:strand:+ start:3013 stop:3918 length:906 start_codon:yes stop_codon:yes gene_type:complete
MIINSSEIFKRLLDIKHGRVKEGLKIGVPDIDEYLRYKQGNFNLLIGHANVGKTTVILYLFVIWALKHKKRFLIWSSENTPQSIQRKIVEFKMRKPITKAEDADIKDALEWSDTYFKIIDVEELYTYKELLEEAKDIKDAWDYDAILIDPYNSLIKDKQLYKEVGGHEYDYQVSTEFRLFAKRNNITLFLNAHGVTEALRRMHPKGHEYEGLPMPLNIASVEGGGKWGNRCDDLICIHRYTSHPTDWIYSNLLVLKIKEMETGGRCTPFDEPIKLKMEKNNIGFTFMDKDLLDKQKKELLF